MARGKNPEVLCYPFKISKYQKKKKKNPSFIVTKREKRNGVSGKWEGR